MKLEGEAEKRMHRILDATVVKLGLLLSSVGNYWSFKSSDKTQNTRVARQRILRDEFEGCCAQIRREDGGLAQAGPYRVWEKWTYLRAILAIE